MTPRSVSLIGASLATLLSLSGCGGDPDTSGTLQGGNSVNNMQLNDQMQASMAGSSGSNGPSFAIGPDDQNNGPGLAQGQMLAAEDICESISVQSTVVPVDMLIMLDQSVSMTEPVSADSTTTRWAAVTEALRAFFAHPDAQGIRIAYDFFANPADNGPDLGTYQCDAANYATPEVELNDIGTAGPQIDGLLGPMPLGTFTPTYPALDGALQWANASAEANPDRATIVLLATDGLPYSNGSCADDIPAIADLARAAYVADTKVRTFLIGVGVGQANMQIIADQGGGEAFLIDGADVAGAFLTALLTIVNQPASCDFALPAESSTTGEPLDPTRAQILLTDGSGDTRQITEVAGAADCNLTGSVGGFYYNVPTAPTRLTLCPETCTDLGRGSIKLDFACKDDVPIQ